jgi:ABC-type multidrug transport system permease subunit
MFDMLPLRVVPPLLLGSIAYYMIGLYPPVENFFKFLLVLVLFNLTASSLCLVIAAICGANLAAANLIGVMTMLFNMLFGGFLINKVHIPGWLSWLQYLSFYNYAFEAVLVNELEEISLEDRKVGIPIQIPGPLILDTLGFKTGNYWPDVISLIWMFIAFLALGFVILQVYVKERR